MAFLSRQSIGLVWLCLLAQPLFGLDPNRALTQAFHRIWQTPEGLPPTAIRGILQTSDGFLWLSTDQGLLRFDGIRFSSLAEIAGFSGDQDGTGQLLEDSQHDLWSINNSGGLLRVQGSRHVEKLAGDFHCLTAGKSRDLWGCSARGLVHRGSNGVWETYNSENIEAASVRKDGTVWTGGHGNVLKAWNGRGFRSYTLQEATPNTRVQAMLGSKDNALWIGTADGLIEVRDGQERVRMKTPVLSLSEGSDGSIWVGTTEGFSRLKSAEVQSFGVKQGLSQSTVYAVYEDREGSIWVGTKRGLNQFLDRRTIPITTSEGLPTNDTGPVLQDPKGNLWVGTLGAGLARMEGPHASVLTKRDGLSSDWITALDSSHGGALWIGTNAGLNRLEQGRLTTVSGLPSNSIRSLYTGKNGDLWVGTGAGLAVFRDGHIAMTRQLSSPVLSFAESAAGTVYAAIGNAGLMAFKADSLDLLPAGEIALRDADVLYTDESGLLWTGTVGGGLALLRAGKITRFTARDGLYDDDIYGVIADKQGALWLASGKGIFCVQRAELLAFAAGLRQRITSTPYSPLDGLQTVECRSGISPAARRLNDGRLSFSTIRGLLVVDPTHLGLRLGPPPVEIESLTVDGRNEDPGRVHDLSPGNRNLEFQYAGLSFRSPTRLSFRYKLENFDHGWIDAQSRREAFYTNVPPGNYRFRVTSCNIDGSCNETGAAVAFTIPAHFYQRVWFLPAGLILLALAGRMAYRMRIQQLRRDFRLVLGERTRIARELHDTLIQGFSGVTMQMQALSVGLPGGSREKLREIIDDAGNCLQQARRSVAGLRGNPEDSSDLPGLLGQAAKQTTVFRKVALDLGQVPNGLPAHAEENLLKIAQEAITNAEKHSGAGQLKISLRGTGKSIRLSVHDDGAGFEENEWTCRAGHYGLIGMRERAESMGADIRISSKPGHGTMVAVTLPLASRGRIVDGKS
jgi:ligand-binding sensor domain-containing protein